MSEKYGTDCLKMFWRDYFEMTRDNSWLDKRVLLVCITTCKSKIHVNGYFKAPRAYSNGASSNVGIQGKNLMKANFRR